MWLLYPFWNNIIIYFVSSKEKRTMKKFILFSIIYWLITLYVISFLKSGEKKRIHYYHSKNFDSSFSLFEDLLKQKSTDGIFEWCCDCIQFYAHKMGFTYEELNIVIFVIFQPAMIIYLFCYILHLRLSFKKRLLNLTTGS